MLHLVEETTVVQTTSVLITDLDNTLYDWVEMWGAAFAPLLRGIVERSGLPQEQIEKEIRAIHQKYGTSEYSFVIQEISSLKQLHPGENLAEIYREAIAASSEGRRRTLRLYPGVLETLERLKGRGVLIVGYTESRAFYTKRRIRRLSMDGVIDVLYSPPDHDLPDSIAQIRSHEAGYYELQRTRHKQLREGELKPNPEVLLDIIRDIGAKPDDCVYVGDSLMKDVAMAQRAGVRDVHAAYGAAQDREIYDLLRRVSHWPDEAVQKERVVHETVTPRYVLTKSFSELFDLFEFERWDPPRKDPTMSNGGSQAGEKEKLLVEAWKVCVDVQKHFNDLELRVRSFALSYLGVVLGAGAVAWQQGPRSWLTSLLALVGLIGWGAFYIMDGLWYHRLLKGSVTHGTAVEDALATETGGNAFGLTKAISASSPTSVFWLSMHSKHKLGLFYIGGAIALILMGVGARALPRPPASTEPETLRVILSCDSLWCTARDTSGITVQVPRLRPR